MIDNALHDRPIRHAKRPEPEEGKAHGQGKGNESWHNPLPNAHTLLGSPRLSGRGNSQVRAQTLLGAQQRYGNRAVQRSTAMPQAQNLEDLVRSLGDRERGGPLGMLGSIVGDAASSVGDLVGPIVSPFGALTADSSDAAWEGASAEGSAPATEDYGHNTASTAREAERSAATKPSEIPLSREELEGTLYGR
jgi:hypothetical protein